MFIAKAVTKFLVIFLYSMGPAEHLRLTFPADGSLKMEFVILELSFELSSCFLTTAISFLFNSEGKSDRVCVCLYRWTFFINLKTNTATLHRRTRVAFEAPEKSDWLSGIIQGIIHRC